MGPKTRDLDERDCADRALLQHALDSRRAPDGAIVPIVLDAIAQTHDIHDWTPDHFEKVFLGEAMHAWHGTVTQRSGTTLVATSPTCPVSGPAANNARVCQLCRALHAYAAQEAYGRALHGLTFTRLITRGDPCCEMRVACEAARV